MSISELLQNLQVNPVDLIGAIETPSLTPVEELKVIGSQITPDVIHQVLDLNVYIQSGYKLIDAGFWAAANTEMTLKSFSVNHVVLRFSPDFTKAVAGTTSAWQAGFTNQAYVKQTYQKEFPTGKPFNEVAGKPANKPQLTGRGLTANIIKDDDGRWVLDWDTAILSHHYNPAQIRANAVNAAQDILSNVLKGNPYNYLENNKVTEADLSICNKLISGASVHPDLLKRVIAIAKWYDVPLLNSFTYRYEDFQQFSLEQHKTAQVITQVRSYMRTCIENKLGQIARNSGVAPGQYGEFQLISFPYKTKLAPANTEMGFTSEFIDMSHYWNAETQLPGGILVLCRPKAPTVGVNTERPLPYNGRGKRLFTAPVRVKAPLTLSTEEISIISPVAPLPSLVNEAVVPTVAAASNILFEEYADFDDEDFI